MINQIILTLRSSQVLNIIWERISTEMYTSNLEKLESVLFYRYGIRIKTNLHCKQNFHAAVNYIHFYY